MKLDRYLFENKIKASVFAKKVGLTQQTITCICKGRVPSFNTARKIVMATNHEVGFAELMPEVYISMISEYLRTQKER